MAVNVVILLLLLRITVSHTCRLVSQSRADRAALLEVDVPALRFAGLVLERKGEHGVALLDGILLVGFARSEGRVDGVESDRGRKLVWKERNVRTLRLR